MGLFNDMLSSSSSKYSQKEYPLSEIEIKKLVPRGKISSLSQREEETVEQALINRRRGDGKISLRQVHEVLTQLKNQNRISGNDKASLMKIFIDHFAGK